MSFFTYRIYVTVNNEKVKFEFPTLKDATNFKDTIQNFKNITSTKIEEIKDSESYLTDYKNGLKRLMTYLDEKDYNKC